MNSHTRAILTAGLADVLHVVEDAPYLASIVQAAQKEREAQLLAGRALLECVRITARHFPEMQVLVDLGERVFGEDGM